MFPQDPTINALTSAYLTGGYAPAVPFFAQPQTYSIGLLGPGIPAVNPYLAQPQAIPGFWVAPRPLQPASPLVGMPGIPPGVAAFAPQNPFVVGGVPSFAPPIYAQLHAAPIQAAPIPTPLSAYRVDPFGQPVYSGLPPTGFAPAPFLGAVPQPLLRF